MKLNTLAKAKNKLYFGTATDNSELSDQAYTAILNDNTQSFGDGFNKADGGVYATEWTDSAINIWFFANSSVPSDIKSGSPDPTGWGTPAASFSGDCDISSHFSNLQIVRYLPQTYTSK